MVAVSLMPPVDQCASCEGKRAASKARDIGAAREAEALDKQGQAEAAQPSPGSLPPPGADDAATKPVDTVARPLLSPNLAVQASHGTSEISQSHDGANPALRLQAAQAYGATPSRGFSQ